MLFLLKYRFLQIVREFSVMFWALAFPLILATLFYFSFGRAGLSSTGDLEWDKIKVCVIAEHQETQNSSAFLSFLDTLDQKTLDILPCSSEQDALKALEQGKINGIYYASETPCLTVGKNGLKESILTSLLTSYTQNAAMLTDIAASHPENLDAAIYELNNYRQIVKETSLGGETLDPNVQYFFALIAYACLSGTFLGVRACFDSQANLTPLGARRSITPTHRLTMILTDMFVLVAIHFINIMILTIYISNILGISLGKNIPALLLVNLMGSTIGITLGLAFGSLTKMSLNMKMGFCVLLTLFPAFLAGLMFGNMKNMIEQHLPILNRINPAAVLSDAYYCMGVYNDMGRFMRCILILSFMSIILLLAAFLGIRRERYDSI